MTELAEMTGYHIDEHGCYIPNVKGAEPSEELKKWGKRRMAYLRKHKKIMLDIMVAHGEQFDDALSKQHEAEERELILAESMKGKYGLTETLFLEDQAEYRKRERNMQEEIENIIMEEIICV